jgi:hypothetical protein
MQLNAVEKHSEWIDGSKQKEAFLIEGQPKQFTCTSFGNLMHAILLCAYSCFNYLLVFVCIIAILGITSYKWVLDGRAVDEVYLGVREDCHTLNIGLNENCTDIEVYQYSTFENDGKVVTVSLQCM